MKKHTLFSWAMLAFLCFCIHTSYAQLRLGFRAGLNASTQNLSKSPNRFAEFLDGFPLEDQSLKLSFHVGILGDYEINREWSFQSGLIYNDKGARFFFKDKSDGEKVVIAETVNIGYLEIPALFVYKLKSGRFSYLRLGAGGYLGLSLIGNYRLKSRGLEAIDEKDFNESKVINFGSEPGSDYKGSEAGLALEVSYETNGFIFGTGFNYGLTDIKNDSKAIHNQVLQASMSYLWGASYGSKKKRRRR
jgi:hypothetical protein